MTMSLIRLTIGLVPVSLFALAFFGFNLWGLGLALIAFFVNLVLTAWAIGLVVAGLVLRNGMGAEALAWSVLFFLMPFACVYYPVSSLPDWLRWIVWMSAADLCVRGTAGRTGRPCLSRRPDARGAGDQPRPAGRRRGGFSQASGQRARRRLAPADGRMSGTGCAGDPAIFLIPFVTLIGTNGSLK